MLSHKKPVTKIHRKTSKPIKSRLAKKSTLVKKGKTFKRGKL